MDRALTKYEMYEIRAEAFRLMTGHMAPGKDPASATYPAPFEERQAAWDEWCKTYGHCVGCTIAAAEAWIGEEGG